MFKININTFLCKPYFNDSKKFESLLLHTVKLRKISIYSFYFSLLRFYHYYYINHNNSYDPKAKSQKKQSMMGCKLMTIEE